MRTIVLLSLLLLACQDDHRAPWPLCQWFTRFEIAPGKYEERWCAYNGRGMMLCKLEPLQSWDVCE